MRSGGGDGVAGHAVHFDHGKRLSRMWLGAALQPNLRHAAEAQSERAP
jgi:hypothetical protein